MNEKWFNLQLAYLTRKKRKVGNADFSAASTDATSPQLLHWLVAAGATSLTVLRLYIQILLPPSGHLKTCFFSRCHEPLISPRLWAPSRSVESAAVCHPRSSSTVRKGVRKRKEEKSFSLWDLRILPFADSAPWSLNYGSPKGHIVERYSTMLKASSAEFCHQGLTFSTIDELLVLHRKERQVFKRNQTKLLNTLTLFNFLGIEALISQIYL